MNSWCSLVSHLLVVGSAISALKERMQRNFFEVSFIKTIGNPHALLLKGENGREQTDGQHFSKDNRKIG